MKLNKSAIQALARKFVREGREYQAQLIEEAKESDEVQEAAAKDHRTYLGLSETFRNEHQYNGTTYEGFVQLHAESIELPDLKSQSRIEDEIILQLGNCKAIEDIKIIPY